MDIVNMTKRRVCISGYVSPVGEIVIGSCGDAICMCDWVGSRRHEANLARMIHRLDAELEYGRTDVICDATFGLDEYFAGRRRVFSIPLLMSGTDFQCRVWSELQKIPYGTVLAYGELARSMGCGRGVRSVASAVAANPISIFVPCHRIISARGTLAGYAGGLEAKRFLLALEQTP